MQARDLMTKNLIVIPPEMPVVGVAELLASRGISAVPVVDAAGTPIGLVTEGDLIRRLADDQPGPMGWFLGLFADGRRLAERFAKAHGATAADVMSRTLVTVTEDAPAEEVARLMEQHRIRRVPVLRDGKLVGVVSRADLLRAVLTAPQPPAAGTVSDTRLLRSVLDAMRDQPWVDTFYIFPSVKDAVVTFYGFHRSDEARRSLQVLAREVPGVVGVADETKPMPFFLRASL